MQGLHQFTAASDMAKRVLEPHGLFHDTPIELESSGIPIEIDLEDVASAIFSVANNPGFANNRLWQYMRDFTIDYARGIPNGELLVRDYFPSGVPARAEPARKNSTRELGVREVMSELKIDKRRNISRHT